VIYKTPCRGRAIDELKQTFGANVEKPREVPMKPSRRKDGLFYCRTILFVALLLIMTAQQGLAGVFTVTDTNDRGTGSLRRAILDANGSPGLDTIGGFFFGTKKGKVTFTTSFSID